MKKYIMVAALSVVAVLFASTPGVKAQGPVPDGKGGESCPNPHDVCTTTCTPTVPGGEAPTCTTTCYHVCF